MTKQIRTAEQIFSPEYTARLIDDYGSAVTELLMTERRAPLIGNREDSVAFAVVGGTNMDPTDDPIVLVNGILAGRVANGAFAAALHQATNRPVIISEQYGGRSHGRTATAAQANAYASIIEKMRLMNSPVDVVTHSLGSLVLSDLLRQADREGWHCFDQTSALLMAPAGLKKESSVGFIKRYVGLMKVGSAMEKFDDSYWQFEGEMFAAGQQNLKAHPFRFIREGLAVKRGRLNLAALSRRLGQVGIVEFHDDVLFGDEPLKAELAAILGDSEYGNVSVIMPFSSDLDVNGKAVSARGSDHNDQQFNPGRVAPAVAQFLSTKR